MRRYESKVQNHSKRIVDADSMVITEEADKGTCQSGMEKLTDFTATPDKNVPNVFQVKWR